MKLENITLEKRMLAIYTKDERIGMSDVCKALGITRTRGYRIRKGLIKRLSMLKDVKQSEELEINAKVDRFYTSVTNALGYT